MSNTVDGFWQAEFWSSSFWADGFWEEIAGHHGGIGHRKRRHELCVVSVDGQDYRVRFENLQSFLERKREEAAKPKVVKIKKSRKALAKSKPPRIIVKSAPPEYKMQIQASVDRTNEILRKIWDGNLTRLINEAEQEEALALVLMMED